MTHQHTEPSGEIEENELIAAFMGGYKRDMGYGDMIWDHESYMSPLVCKYPSELEYGSNWQWLMPVVEKIGKFNFCINLSQNVYSKNGKKYNSIRCDISDFIQKEIDISEDAERLIDATYTAIVKFIKWYNQTQSIQ